MRINNFFAKKKSAQAMVEFALALPILLLLLYGVLEAGRLLFLYSTVVTASRQAVRYGAATGENDLGTPRYNDCDGIRAAANKVGFLSGPDGFNNITLYWDTGAENNDETPYCAGPIGDITTDDLEGNSTRLVVQVTDRFIPVLPNFLPFLERDITAKSARTILYSVPIVMDQDPSGFYQERTTTTITADTPDPSAPNETITLTITVVSDIDNDTVTTPTGKILITGVDDATGCGSTAGIDLVDSGVNGMATVTCTVVFSTSGNKVISATYSGDDTHLPSSDVENHTVEVSTTTTEITSITPNPTTRNQNISVTVRVTGGSTPPTGTVEVDGGSGNVSCTVTSLSTFSSNVSTGTCIFNGGYNNLGTKTITATYSGDAGHLSSSGTGTVLILAGTATASNTPPPTLSPTATVQPTATLSPTATISPTATLPPTATATDVPNCNLITITHGPLTISGTMSMTITNNTGSPLLVGDVFVDWYNEKGHQRGGDKTLKLQSATLDGVTFFGPGNLYASSTTIRPNGLYVPIGTSSIIFTFHQTYDSPDGGEKIIISLASNGCTSVTIDSSR